MRSTWGRNKNKVFLKIFVNKASNKLVFHVSGNESSLKDKRKDFKVKAGDVSMDLESNNKRLNQLCEEQLTLAMARKTVFNEQPSVRGKRRRKK